MSIIAVECPDYWSPASATKQLKLLVKGEFEILGLADPEEEPKRKLSQKQTQLLYVKLSETLDPQFVIETINSKAVKNYGRLRSYIPEEVPDVSPSFDCELPAKAIEPLSKIFIEVHNELLVELQTVYTKLNDLSSRYGHKLLYKIAVTIMDRLQEVVTQMENVPDSHYTLSRRYRIRYPYKTDTNFVISTLKELEKELKIPSTTITENDLMAYTIDSKKYLGLPYFDVLKSFNVIAKRINFKLIDYADSLKEEETDHDDDLEVARKKIRSEIKTLANRKFLYHMSQQVMNEQIIPDNTPQTYKMYVYFYPNLPPRYAHRLLNPLCSHVARNKHIYNCFVVTAHKDQFKKITKLNNTTIGVNQIALIVVREFPASLYELPEDLKKQTKMMFDDSSY